MDNTVYMLWFEQEREDCEDCELLIGVYSSELEAQPRSSGSRTRRALQSSKRAFVFIHTS